MSVLSPSPNYCPVTQPRPSFSERFPVLPRLPLTPRLILPACCPFQLGAHFVNHLIDIHLFTSIDAATSPTEFIARSLVNTVSLARPGLSPLNWLAAYDQDADTKLMLQWLTKTTSFSTANTNSLHPSDRDHIRRDRLSLVKGKLVVFQPVQNNTEMLMLIIVPVSLRHDIFSAYHATPSAGHMGIYKTLHRIVFFGPTVGKLLLIGASNVLTVSLPLVLLLVTVSLSSLGSSAALSTSFVSIFGNPVKL
jgi:hypothetical protein